MTSWPCSVRSLMAMVLPMVPVGTKRAASLPAISAARCSRWLTVGSSPYTSSPTSASIMARRISGVGLVTVSLLKSIMCFGWSRKGAETRRKTELGILGGLAALREIFFSSCQELLEDFVGEEDAAAGEAEVVALGFEEAIGKEALDGGGVTVAVGGVRADAFGEAEADEEALLVGLGVDGRRRGAGGEVVVERFRILAAHAAIEGMGVGAEAYIGFELPVFEIVAGFEAGAGEVGDLATRDAEGVEPLDGGFVEIGGLVV